MLTNSPESRDLYLSAVDGDDLDENERTELHAAIVAAEDELDLERGVTEDELSATLRTIP